MCFWKDAFRLQPIIGVYRDTITCAVITTLSWIGPSNKRTFSDGTYRYFSHDSRLSLRVLFFGTDNFAVENLKLLTEELKCGKTLKQLDVVTSNKVKHCAVGKYSLSNGLKTLEWPLSRNPEGYDVGLVASFGYLIPEKIIKSFPLGMLNVHASLLPRWRGAAPIVHAIMNGDKETGVSIMRIMPKRFDIGDILAQSQVDIGPHETNVEVSNKLAIAGARLLVTCLQDLPKYSKNAQPQSEEGITHAPKVKPSLGLVKWQEKSAESVYNLWRALFGICHLTSFWHGTQVKLFDACYFHDKDTSCVDRPGKIIFSKSSRVILVMCAGGGKVGFRKIGVAGKKPMSAEDFYNGYMSKRSANEWYFN